MDTPSEPCLLRAVPLGDRCGQWWCSETAVAVHSCKCPRPRMWWGTCEFSGRPSRVSGANQPTLHFVRGRVQSWPDLINQ